VVSIIIFKNLPKMGLDLELVEIGTTLIYKGFGSKWELLTLGYDFGM
jgi:hypothetical protein